MLHKILTKLRSGVVTKAAFVAAAVALPMLFTGVASADAFCNYDGNNGDGYCLEATGPQNTSNVYSCDYNYGGGCSAGVAQVNWDFLGVSGGDTELSNNNWNGCIGDYGNNSGRADAALDECPTQGSAGWGTKLTYLYCSNGIGSGYDFFDVHWSDWLGPQAWGNGQKEYLNKPSAFCFADDSGL